MSIVRVQVTIPSDTALPEDATVNRWHFSTSTTPSNLNDRGDIATALTNFYQAIDQYLSPSLASPAVMDFYNLEDPEPRVPVDTRTFTVTPSASDGLPNEVACVLSFQATPQSGVNQARRRNRVFLGPLAINAQQMLLGGPRVNGNFRQDLAAAAQTLLNASIAAANWSWIVRSETSGTFAVVANGWVDDAFDTQRRRGLARTQRDTFQ